jgi:hypothetical protein
MQEPVIRQAFAESHKQHVPGNRLALGTIRRGSRTQNRMEKSAKFKLETLCARRAFRECKPADSAASKVKNDVFGPCKCCVFRSLPAQANVATLCSLGFEFCADCRSTIDFGLRMETSEPGIIANLRSSYSSPIRAHSLGESRFDRFSDGIHLRASAQRASRSLYGIISAGFDGGLLKIVFASIKIKTGEERIVEANSSNHSLRASSRSCLPADALDED